MRKIWFCKMHWTSYTFLRSNIRRLHNSCKSCMLSLVVYSLYCSLFIIWLIFTYNRGYYSKSVTFKWTQLRARLSSSPCNWSFVASGSNLCRAIECFSSASDGITSWKFSGDKQARSLQISPHVSRIYTFHALDGKIKNPIMNINFIIF